MKQNIEEKKEGNEGFHIVNGAKTDILFHIRDLIDDVSEIDGWARYLADAAGLTVEEARKKILYHLGGENL